MGSQPPNIEALVRTKRRYYTPNEVGQHSQPSSLWLSWLDHVYDLSALVQENAGDPLLKPILEHGGQDISHWFNAKTGDDEEKHANCSTLNSRCISPCIPNGRFIHVPPPLPRSDWKTSHGTPWWLDYERYRIGKLSKKTRKIRIINTLTGQEHILEVAAEESLREIQDRYLEYNAHARGYMWKRLGKLLDMSMTLQENGVSDESAVFEELGINEDNHLPALHLYFSDDLTVA